MTPDQICEFIKTERSTVASAVPTIWGGIMQYGRENDIDISSLRLGTSGGAAIPRSLMEGFEQKYGLRIVQGWGMTETSPVAGMAWPPARRRAGHGRSRWPTGSRPVGSSPGVQMRIVSDDGDVLPWDGVAVGEIEVRGPWITGSYFAADVPGEVRRRLAAHRRHRHHRPPAASSRSPTAARTSSSPAANGSPPSSWRTCSPAAPTSPRPRSSASRTRSGPSVRWPRSLLRSGAQASPAELAKFLDGKVASWQVPENWTFIDEVPKTTVGKFDKKLLRSRYADGEFTVERTR